MSNPTIKNSNCSCKSLNDLYTQAVLSLIKSKISQNADEIEYLIEVLKKETEREEM